MKIPARINRFKRQSAIARSESDLRGWCRKLECTELEVRDTVRAVLRLMASANWVHVHH
jgi:hypothetical protein